LQKNDHNRRIAVAAPTPIFGLGAAFHGLQKDIRPADRPRRQPLVSDGTPVPAAAAGLAAPDDQICTTSNVAGWNSSSTVTCRDESPCRW